MALFMARPLGALAQAADGPRPPCGTTPQPSYAPPGVAPAIEVWHAPEWTASACTGWASPHPILLVTLAGSFRYEGGAPDLLARFGRISSLRGIRYWSVGDRGWRTLVTGAAALDGPVTRRRRTDFAVAEMARGVDLYFAQEDSRSSSEVIYRMRVLESEPDRVAIAVENTTSVRFLLVPLFAPGDLRCTSYLERLSPGVWGYYALWGIRAGAQTSGHEASSVNRALAFYRHVAGVPTDQEPPVARR
ncbi:hypothetical protein E2C06_35350 [Dankookia rubra]|uniref:Uncharacterized protein n=1 Tax=Dankookia rubra TaxID=1442381 RepID=A0A4R5Q4P1_9PROT|nr:DUF6675 family protein [Dankookia rubra]TDH57922.1 hypothetical protein E2C06_35350 [Dankookia rubra]